MAELADNGLNRRISEVEDVLKECEAVEGDIAALRVAYEQYFLGSERHPPSDKHTALKKRLNKLKNMYVRQTAVKFRVQTLHGKFSTYERLWSRTLKEIEDGTYKRDLFKAKLKAQQQKKEPAKEKPAAHDVVEDISDAEVLEEVPLAAAPVAKSSPGTPALGSAAVTPSSAGAPALGAAPVAKSSSGMPAIKPVSSPGMPAVAGTSPLGVPIVAPVTRSSPGMPAVVPAAAKSNPTGVPAVPSVSPLKQSSPGMPALGATPATKSSSGLPAITAPVTKSSPGMPAVAPAARSNPTGSPAAMPQRTVSAPGLPAVRPPTAPARPAASASGGGDISEAKLKAVYDAYVTAKKRCQEDVSKLSYDQVAANLRKQVPELMKKHNASGVDFKVVIKDGKAVLKAVPK